MSVRAATRSMDQILVHTHHCDGSLTVAIPPSPPRIQQECSTACVSPALASLGDFDGATALLPRNYRPLVAAGGTTKGKSYSIAAALPDELAATDGPSSLENKGGPPTSMREPTAGLAPKLVVAGMPVPDPGTPDAQRAGAMKAGKAAHHRRAEVNSDVAPQLQPPQRQTALSSWPRPDSFTTR
ncbi:hypothetical protein TgHK011_009154 [Trichoderma gracile]|nr:hypothetical protein TgHK011_009154 [Trichoderma gracile]